MRTCCETEKKAYGYYNDTTHVIFNLLNNARAVSYTHLDVYKRQN